MDSATLLTETEVTATEGLDLIHARIAPLRARLTTHPIYSAIRTEAQLRLFLESHVFAVWDFMSLLKALQRALTCVDVPWVPSAYPGSRRFINEIVLGEESDDFRGRPTSHFELYLEAMREAGADTTPIQTLLAGVAAHPQVVPPTIPASVPAAAYAFLTSTFAQIAAGNTAALAATFTFGREDLIPDIFRELVRDLNQEHPGRFGTLLWYLERHIEVDGEDHGPLSLRMVADLCGGNAALWETAAEAAASALTARLALWDGILQQIENA